jgi:hypothetical protein
MRRARSPQPSSESREDAHGYFLLVRHMVQRHSCPLALYHDRHGIFSQTGAATERESLPEQLAGKQEPTQFGRRRERVGDHHDSGALAASERAGGTALWHEASIGWSWNCVWQAPAPWSKPMRSCRRICRASMPSLPSKQPSWNWPIVPCHRQWIPRPCAASSMHARWRLPNTVQLGEHRLQLLPDKERRSYARAHVEVHERLDGSLAVYYAGRCLLSTPAPLEAPVLRARAGRLTAAAHPSLSVAADPTSKDASRQDTAPAAAQRGSIPGPEHRLLQEIAPASAGSVGRLAHCLPRVS